MPKKPVLELEELLDRFFLKEWIQEDLRSIGESSTGSKPELEYRFLHSRRAQSRTVRVLAAELLNELPLTELKQVAQFLGLKIPKGKDGIVPHILESTDIEPYVVRTKRRCGVCDRTTQQELHFDDSWNPVAFKCQVCSTSIPARGESLGLPSTQSNMSKSADAAVANLPFPMSPGDAGARELAHLPPVVNIVEVRVGRPEPAESPEPPTPSTRSDDVLEIKNDLKEIKDSHGQSYAVSAVLGLLAIGLALLGIGVATSSDSHYIYEIAGIGVCLVAAGYFALWFWVLRLKSKP